jgi:hypothetical protein
MPTGYTAMIDGTCTFKKFAMTCARAFGSCITMRDDPFDKEIPEKFEESPYHKDRYKEETTELARLEAMSITDAEIQARQEYEKKVAHNSEHLEKCNTQISYYGQMLKHVYAWNPPTHEHTELKKFMIQQITDSIKYDDMRQYYEENMPVLQTGKQWLKSKIAQTKDSIKYHEKNIQKETELTAFRNKWIKDLRDSLEK